MQPLGEINVINRGQEIEKNLEFFLQELPNIPAEYSYKVALLHHQKIEGYFDTITDAVRAGNKIYPDMMFSI